MSTTLQTDQTIPALEDIQKRLGQQLAANEAQRVQLQGELVDQQVKLSQCQVHAQQVRGEISTWQTMDQRNALDLKRAQQDLEHARGSSLEQSRMERLTAADSARQKSQHELSILTTELEKDTKEADRITEQVQALAVKLSELAGARDELSSARSRLSRELCASILESETEAIEAVGTEIARLQGLTAEAIGYEVRVLAQAAVKLQPWERECLDFVAKYIRLAEDPQAVVAAKAQLAEAKIAVTLAEGLHRQSGDDINPTIQGRRQEALNLSAHIETLLQASRQHAAVALLRQIRQPAPVPDDLAQAQALHAQAQAQVQVVVEEAPAQGPKKERYAPQAGIRAFAPAGAVPTVAPSLLNPKVRE